LDVLQLELLLHRQGQWFLYKEHGRFAKSLHTVIISLGEINSNFQNSPQSSVEKGSTIFSIFRFCISLMRDIFGILYDSPVNSELPTCNRSINSLVQIAETPKVILNSITEQALISKEVGSHLCNTTLSLVPYRVAAMQSLEDLISTQIEAGRSLHAQAPIQSRVTIILIPEQTPILTSSQLTFYNQNILNSFIDEIALHDDYCNKYIDDYFQEYFDETL
jgi:hypothetical protein